MTERVVDLTGSDAAAERAAAPARSWPILAWAGGWSAFVVVMAGVVSAQKHVPLGAALVSEGINYYTLAAISLILWFASRRIGEKPWSLAPRIAVHVALCVVLVASWQALYGAYLRLAIGPHVWEYVFKGTWMFQMMNAFVLYGGVLGGTLAIQATARARAHERRQHELALLARDAELRALNAQLEPHFLLNTLNSVMALMDSQPADARAMLERLSELLKAAFDEMQEHDVTLGRELSLIEAYLGIEQVRLADRLRVTIDVPDSLRDVRVPPFLLQPIVENAIKHGVAPFGRIGSVAIRARRHGAVVRVEIADSGPGFDGRSGRARGRGFALAERRLRAFEPTGEIRMERGADDLFTVSLAFPA